MLRIIFIVLFWEDKIPVWIGKKKRLNERMDRKHKDDEFV